MAGAATRYRCGQAPVHLYRLRMGTERMGIRGYGNRCKLTRLNGFEQGRNERHPKYTARRCDNAAGSMEKGL